MTCHFEKLDFQMEEEEEESRKRASRTKTKNNLKAFLINETHVMYPVNGMSHTVSGKLPETGN